MENRIFGKKLQKSRPKEKRAKNLIKTIEAEDHFVDRKTPIAFDKTLIGKPLYIWGLTCQHAGVTKNTLLRYNARPGVNRKTPIAFDKTLPGKSSYIWGLTCQHAEGTNKYPFTPQCNASGPMRQSPTNKGGMQRNRN